MPGCPFQTTMTLTQDQIKEAVKDYVQRKTPAGYAEKFRTVEFETQSGDVVSATVTFKNESDDDDHFSNPGMHSY